MVGTANCRTSNVSAMATTPSERVRSRSTPGVPSSGSALWVDPGASASLSSATRRVFQNGLTTSISQPDWMVRDEHTFAESIRNWKWASRARRPGALASHSTPTSSHLQDDDTDTGQIQPGS